MYGPMSPYSRMAHVVFFPASFLRSLSFPVWRIPLLLLDPCLVFLIEVVLFGSSLSFIVLVCFVPFSFLGPSFSFLLLSSMLLRLVSCVAYHFSPPFSACTACLTLAAAGTKKAASKKKAELWPLSDKLLSAGLV